MPQDAIKPPANCITLSTGAGWVLGWLGLLPLPLNSGPYPSAAAGRELRRASLRDSI